jgi:hypothetical protein
MWPLGRGSDTEVEGDEGSLNPSPVIGSVGDSWTVRGFGNEVRELDEENMDWSR